MVKAKTEATKSEKIDDDAGAKSPQAKRGRPPMAKSPKEKKDSVKKTPMKAKAGE